MSQKLDYPALLPPNWKAVYLPLWFAEDFSGLDITSALVGNGPGAASLFLKSRTCLLAGSPFVSAIFESLNCRVDWKVDEGDYIENHDGEKSKFLVAIVHGPKSSILKGERIALNVLSRSCGIATEAHVLKQKGFQVAGSRKTTPGFRLVQKYALLVGGADTHRYDTTASLMLKDNHIDALGGNITEAVKRAKQLASFTQTIEVECRSIDDAVEAADAGADIVMLDNFLPNEADLERLSKLNVKIEISGGITPQNIPQNLQNFIFSMGHLTHSAEIIDFSLKINKSE